jgi:2-keto-3-deoxy-L-rhamnonate aldolase RhmA
MLNNFKNKLKKGEPVFRPFIKSADPVYIEVTGYSGFDFVILDMEPDNPIIFYQKSL